MDHAQTKKKLYVANREIGKLISEKVSVVSLILSNSSLKGLEKNFEWVESFQWISYSMTVKISSNFSIQN